MKITVCCNLDETEGHHNLSCDIKLRTSWLKWIKSEGDKLVPDDLTQNKARGQAALNENKPLIFDCETTVLSMGEKAKESKE